MNATETVNRKNALEKKFAYRVLQSGVDDNSPVQAPASSSTGQAACSCTP